MGPGGGSKQGFDRGHDGRMDVLDGLIGIDQPEEVILHGMKNLPAELEGFPSFEFIALPVTDSDPFEGGIEGEVEKEKQVRLRGKLLIDPADFGGIETPHPLVGHG